MVTSDLRVVLDRLREGAYVVDLQRQITYWNPAAERITGFTSAEVVGRRCADNILIHVDHGGTNLCLAGCPLTHTIRCGEPHESELFLHHRSGHRVPVAVRVAPVHEAGGAIAGAIELFAPQRSDHDVELRMAELERLSLLDELTRLPNRRHLSAELDAQLLLHRATRAPVGVLFFDIDHFKRFNDHHGHATGDLALQTVARTLQAATRPFDIVGRWGGEEFVAVLPNIMQAGVMAAAERLLMLVRATRVETVPEPLSVRVSIGGAMVRLDDTAAAVLSRADAALYASKAAGRDRVSFEAGDFKAAGVSLRGGV